MEAARHFRAEPYEGDVLLLTGERGAAVRDESNGWHDFVRGSLQVVQLDVQDADPVGKGTAVTAAAAMRLALESARSALRA
jgi:hypothetical protein